MEQPSEYLPANNAQDRHVIPIHDPIPGIDLTYASVLRVRAWQNFLGASCHARQAYEEGDIATAEAECEQANMYQEAIRNCSAFIIDTFRIRAN